MLGFEFEVNNENYNFRKVSVCEDFLLLIFFLHLHEIKKSIFSFCRSAIEFSVAEKGTVENRNKLTL
jgi:hypothetical protein